MKINYISDLHLEFDRECDLDPWPGLAPAGDCDVLVVAGDIDDHEHVGDSLDRLVDLAAGPVVAVLGNHDCWHAVPEDVHRSLTGHRAVILNDSAAEVAGQRFVGGTGWYDVDHPRFWNKIQFWADTQIHSLCPSRRSKDFAVIISALLQPDDVVVSHMLPSYRTVSPRWQGNSNNCLFVNPGVEEAVHLVKPRLWIHGHTHDTIDTMLDETRVVCNPRGYVPLMLNPEFDPGKSVSL